jgi:hypothetical protein
MVEVPQAGGGTKLQPVRENYPVGFPTPEEIAAPHAAPAPGPAGGTPAVGVTGAPIGGKALSPQDASKMAGLDASAAEMPRAEAIAFDPRGAPKLNVFQRAGADYKLPESAGRRIRGIMERSVFSSLKMESRGMGGTPDEIKGLVDQFAPQAGDSPEIVRDKMDHFYTWLGGTYTRQGLPLPKPLEGLVAGVERRQAVEGQQLSAQGYGQPGGKAVEGLTAAQWASMKPATVKNLKDEQLNAITRDQFAALPPEVRSAVLTRKRNMLGGDRGAAAR